LHALYKTLIILESVLCSGRIYGIRKNLVLFYTTPYQS
jgi:hypothetical protein